MAKLGWVGSVALAAGASAGAAAAQFGLGYGLGIISWTPLPSTGPQTSDSVWVAGLAWTAFIATTSTVVGAICADRRSAGEIGAAPPRPGGPTEGAPGMFASAIWRILLAVSAAVGALLSVALVLGPARAAIRPDTATPQLIAGGYAVIGIVAGILIAVFALVARSGATNVVVTALWLWLLAIASVIDGVVAGRGLGSAPLGVWPFNTDTHALIWSWPIAVSMLGAAFVIGVGVAWAGMRRGDNGIGASWSGLFGPLLVLVAYALTAPHLVGVSDTQIQAYVYASPAVVAGVFGSLLVWGITTTRANARAAAKNAGAVEFRAPSDPTGSGSSTGTIGKPSSARPTGAATGSASVAGSGNAVGRARPFRRLRGSSDAGSGGGITDPVQATTDDEITQPVRVPAVVPKPASGDTDSSPVVTTAAKASSESSQSSQSSPPSPKAPDKRRR